MRGLRGILLLGAGLMAAAALSGCGFQRASSDDGGDAPGDLGPDAATAQPGADLAGAGDLGAAGADLAAGGGTGPGPLGALPAGFCCTSNDDCRSRDCAALPDATRYCSDECDHDSLCSAWGGSFKCDVNGTGLCIPAAAQTTCVDPSLYHYGEKPIGACCQSGFDKSGQECLGGLCNATGPDSNPFYCTQGCDTQTPCPAPYECNSVGFCSLPDPNAPYTCH